MSLASRKAKVLLKTFAILNAIWVIHESYYLIIMIETLKTILKKVEVEIYLKNEPSRRYMGR